MKQFGIIRANDLNDLFNISKGFESFQLPAGNRIAVVTNGGGPAILTVDSLEKNNLQLAELSEKTRTKLKEIVHPEGSVNNPVDLLPGGTAEQFKKVNEIVASDENVDAVISVFVEPIMVKAFPVIEAINEIISSKPIFQVVMPLPEFWNEYRKNSKSRRPLFRNPDDPAVVISGMLKHKNKSSNEGRLKKEVHAKIDLSKSGEKFLSQTEVRSLSEIYSLPIIEDRIISLKDISSSDFKFPIVLKAIGKKIIHKSELNGVVTNIKDIDELLKNADVMMNNFKNRNIELDSFLIQPFIKAKFELLIGGLKDPSFGPMIMFGTGGKYVEYLQDTVIRSAYLTSDDIDEMIDSTKIGKIICGVRGEKPIDLSKIKTAIKSIAQMMLDNSEIAECDLNPLLIDENNEMFAVDIRIKC
ncbi:MAG: acetate--CoA ligase family protein [Ignavibacteriaceae bacterium]